MDGNTLRNMLQYLPKPSGRVIAVMSYDELLSALSRRTLADAVVIFNTQPRSEPGEHWMAMVSGNSKAYVFDSLACFPRLFCGEVLARCLDEGFEEVGWSGTALQSAVTNVCGDYAYVFCALVAHRGGMCDRAVSDMGALGRSQHS